MNTQTGNYEVYIRASDKTRRGQIDGFSTLTLLLNYNDASKWIMEYTLGTNLVVNPQYLLKEAELESLFAFKCGIIVVRDE